MRENETALEVLPDTLQGQNQSDSPNQQITPALEEDNEAECNEIQPAQPPVVVPGSNVFISRPDGVYYREQSKNGDERTPVWLCSPLQVVAQTRDASGGWGLYLAVQDPLGETHHWAMPRSMMGGNGTAYREELLRMGLRLGYNGNKRLYEYLMSASPERLIRCVSSTGWHDGRFVLPDFTYGPQVGEEIIIQGSSSENPFRAQGALEGWQDQIGRLCEGNSRLALAVSAAFAGPLLHLFGQESGGFHFTGNSSVGKSTLLMAAGSVCGGGGQSGYVRTWRTTDNSLEAVAPAHNDALLCLDEIGQVAPSAAAGIAYMLANGQGKGRARKDGSSRLMHSWRVIFLSTGELKFEQKVREERNQRFMAGQSVRVVDIPADAGAGLGAFENLHGFRDGKAFSEHLNRAAMSYYGLPFRRYLELLTTDRDHFKEKASVWIRRFEAEACPPHADGQVKRVANRFGLLAAAGELATEMGILPWRPGCAFWAAKRCFQDWVVARGGIGAAEEFTALIRVRDFIALHGTSRFEPWDSDKDERIPNRVGYRRKVNESVQYLVYVGPFKSEICAGSDHLAVARYLLERGHLIPGKNGDLAKTHKLKGEDTTARFYTIKASIFADNLEEIRESEEEPT